jgi:sterol 3beta-glucosyltransferase
MKLLILTVGSRGDVQPFIALGIGLQQAGYDITLAAPALFESFVRGYGLKFAPVNDDVLKLKDTAQGKDLLESGAGKKLALIKQVMPMLRRMLDDEWVAAQGSEAIIYHPKSLGGSHIAEALNIPVIMSMPLPMYSSTAAFPMPVMPAWQAGGGTYNRFTYRLVPLLTVPYMGMINKWRKEIGLPPRGRISNELILPNGSPMPVLYSYSSQVIPQPSDWNNVTHATGYWSLPPTQGWQPSPALEKFLSAGEAPVYVGFGSMFSGDPEAKAKIVLEALQKSGQRGLLASGWGGLKATDLPANVIMIEEAPHEWLFPRVKAVVHHGGAGTTAAGLIAGKPTIICPFIADQPFWGRQVQAIGAGAAPIPQNKLTADRLAAAIRLVVTDSAMQHRAAGIGEQLRAEDGVANALSLIQKYIGIPQRILAH